ncbi:hypothetical protein [Streptomyces sp. NBC_01238]|uniref:hypothetical protein n=1 Tax=Streptomyces sp. NBC_01238 TaxID=2903791 RepID=UPI002F90B4CB
MTEQKIGAQLDALGLTADIEDGHRITEATVELTTEAEDGSNFCWQASARFPPPNPGATPVPSPVERRVVTVFSEGQEPSDEQRQRIKRWLAANGIDPKRVALKTITVECNVRGQSENAHIIGFSEFYVDETGSKVIDEKTLRDAAMYQRWVRQIVPLEPDPNWGGWTEQERLLRDASASLRGGPASEKGSAG